MTDLVHSAKVRMCPLSGHFPFCIPCWYVSWAQIEKFLFGISSHSQKVLGPKDEINYRFAIPLDAPIQVVYLGVSGSETVTKWYLAQS